MIELPWIAEARSHVGLKENTSKNSHNPVILRMLSDMGKYSDEARAWWHDDESPWCGLLVGHSLGVAGRYVVREWYRAKAWRSDKLTRLDRPAYGCLVVFDRVGGGHVGFVVGIDATGNLMVLGGNQGNMVSIAPFAPGRPREYYWPSKWNGRKAIKSAPDVSRYMLPLLKDSWMRLSNDEA